MSEIQLPIVLEPQHAESAMGYVLRCVHANGVNLHWLRRAIGLPDMGVFTSVQARSLAWVLQCSESWLANGLGRIQKENGVPSLHCWGHKFYSTNHVRRQWPQLCPECVHLDGYCHRAWELSMATVCSKHKRLLTDECMHCHSRLRWDRPSVDICHCGYGFQPDSKPFHLGRVHQEFALLLEHVTSYDPNTESWNSTALPQFLRNLPVNGLSMLVEALGRLEFEYQILPVGHRMRVLRTHESNNIVQRALDRMPLLDRADVEATFGLVIDQVALKRLINRSTNELELQVASLLLSNIPAAERVFMPQKAKQLSLFP